MFNLLDTEVDTFSIEDLVNEDKDVGFLPPLANRIFISWMPIMEENKNIIFARLNLAQFVN